MPSELTPIVPPARTSDYKLALADPFGYFLHRRLGMAHCLYDSEALSEGSWAHKALELDDFADTTYSPLSRAAYEACLERVLLEKEHAAYTIMGLPYETVLKIKEDETRRAQKALALYCIARNTPVGATFRGLRAFLNQPDIRIVGRELRLQAVLWGVETVGIMDLLVLNERTGLLWIIDAKTTKMRAHVRATSCSIEPQTLIYPRLVEANLDAIRAANPTLDIRGLGGFCHWICERPEIRMSGKDRDYEDVPHTLKSGPRKGQIEIRRQYTSEEPRFENYLKRVKDWFLGEGEYISEASLLSAEPRVEFSVVSWSNIQPREQDARNILTAINWWRLQEPDPALFPKNPNSILSRGEPSIFADFYLTSPNVWPMLMDQHGIIVRHREDQEHGEEDPQ